MASAVSIQTQRSPRLARFYRAELDVLRFLAFSLVFISHADENPAVGALGVPVFFLLSAYLITELLLREHDRTGSVDVKKFYIRRSLRIWPLYFAMLTLGFAVACVKGRGEMPPRELMAYLLLCGNWYSSLHSYLPYGMAALWSIGIEEQFYLVWPTMIRLGGRRCVLVVSAALWVTAQAAVCLMSLRHTPIQPTVWTSSLSQLQYFAIGAAISVVLNGRAPALRTSRRVLLLLGGLLVFVLADTLFHTSVFGQSSVFRTEPGYLITGVGASMIFFGMLGANVPARFSPIVSLGKISYGLYVFHQAAIYVCYEHLHLPYHHLLGPPLALACTIGLALLSYRYFETPFLRLKERFEVVQSRAV